MKKPKKYTGTVQFDVWGNPCSYSYQHTINLTKDNFDNGCIVMDKWDDITRGHIKVPIQYSGDELDLKYGTFPYAPTTIATINATVDRPNFEWTDILEYETHNTGSSSTSYTFKSLNTGKRYVVFSTDIVHFIRRMEFGIITGDFTFRKKNHRFGIIPV